MHPRRGRSGTGRAGAGPGREQERQRQQEAANALQREEDIEFSLHGDLFYDIYPFPCTCEDRLHDCEGNEISGERLEFYTTKSPMRYTYLRWGDTSEAYKERYREYLTRRNAPIPPQPHPLRPDLLERPLTQLSPPQ